MVQTDPEVGNNGRLDPILSKYEKGILRETYCMSKSSIKNVREES